MNRTTIRLLRFLAVLVAFLIVVTFLYQFGMSYLESKPRTLLQSIEWAADTFSTTGYGRDRKSVV